MEKYLRTTGNAKDGLYCYNFCLNSSQREYQPSGAMNMNKFKSVQFEYNTIEPPVDPNSAITTICDGDGNIIVGYDAGKALTTGTNNVAIGLQSLDGSTTSSNIIAIGPNAVGGDHPQNSIGIGSQALNVATGNANIAIGHHASRQLTTGYGNVTLGYLAGDALTTGEQNVFIGEQAGSVSEADADDNVVIGRYAGVYVSDKNTFVGGSAGTGSASSTGDNNIGIGYDALDDYTTGANNIAIGYQSGDNITTGSNNVIIGGVDAPSATGDSQLSISNGNGTVTWITGNSDGGVSIGDVEQRGATVSATTVANTSYLNLLSLAHADYKAITASVHITDSTNNEVQTEMIVAHYDGSAVNYTTYGQIYDGAAAIGSLEANLSGSNIVIQFKNAQGANADLAGSIHATLHA